MPIWDARGGQLRSASRPSRHVVLLCLSAVALVMLLPMRGTRAGAAPLPPEAVLPPTDDDPSETAAAATAASQEARPADAMPPERLYTVRKGDCLSRIARRFHVPVRDLAQANGIGLHEVIRPGQRLRMPSAGVEPEGSPAEGTAGSSLVETALRYRGVPYRYAGMTSRGMDCSGLVARVLRIQGVIAPHSSRELYKLGERVTRKELQAGDLVFFRTTGRGISHVGIYIGEGQFVHASSGGGRVQIDTLDTGYYARRLVGARRVS